MSTGSVVTVLVFALGSFTLGTPLASGQTCRWDGTAPLCLVWREAFAGDHACVTPQVRDQARDDNAQAGARRNPAGGPYGPDTCQSGFVWRNAAPGDHVCVTPQTRSQAAQDNSWRKVRVACP